MTKVIYLKQLASKFFLTLDRDKYDAYPGTGWHEDPAVARLIGEHKGFEVVDITHEWSDFGKGLKGAR